MRLFTSCAAAALIFFGSLPSRAQFPPQPAPPSLQVIRQDPVFGPICAGPLGPGRCADVERFLRIEQIASQIPLQPIGFDPAAGPICPGPRGPGPCLVVRHYIATMRLAEQAFPLQQIGNIPGVGPICAGPLGPGPCDAIRLYLMQQQLGGTPPGMPQIDPRRPQLATSAAAGAGPMCNGPDGPIPCTLLGQASLDRFSGQVPSPSSFGIQLPNNNPQILAAECARRVGLDIAQFAGCTGQQVVLRPEQQAVLDCAVSRSDAASFANCAAPHFGIRLSEDQRLLADCAMRTKGDQNGFVACAGSRYANRVLTADERAVLACAAQANGSASNFTNCAAPHVLEHLSDDQRTLARCAIQSKGDRSGFLNCAGGSFLNRALGPKEQAVLNCALNARDSLADFASCSAPQLGIHVSEDQRTVAQCGLRSNGDRNAFLSCAGISFLNRNLGPNEQAVLNCAANAQGDNGKFAGCAVGQILGGQLSREQRIALECAAQSQGDMTGMATCAGANLFNLQLNPEQQIAVQCVASTGGQPYAAAGCIGSRLTMRELTKCMTDGVGGKGCFGDTNDVVGREGWTARTLGQIAGGPNSVIRNPSQIWGGDNSFVRNPSQIWGGDNSFVRNPSQFWGGNNSIFNNPGQLLPKPAPVQIGTVGGKRICLPWC